MNKTHYLKIKFELREKFKICPQKISEPMDRKNCEGPQKIDSKEAVLTFFFNVEGAFGKAKTNNIDDQLTRYK